MPVLGLEAIKGALDGSSHLDEMDKAVGDAATLFAEFARFRCGSTTVAGDIKERKVKSDRKDKVTWVVESKNERAAVEEFGTGPREGKQGPHNFPMRSYMRATADEDKPQLSAKVQETLGAGKGIGEK